MLINVMLTKNVAKNTPKIVYIPGYSATAFIFVTCSSYTMGVSITRFGYTDHRQILIKCRHCIRIVQNMKNHGI